MNQHCPLCPLFWLCGALLPETDLQKANQRAAKAEEEVHVLKGIMADRGIDAGDRFILRVKNKLGRQPKRKTEREKDR